MEAITTIDPSIVVIEYNSILGSRNYTVPYSKILKEIKSLLNCSWSIFTALVKLGKKKVMLW